MDSEFILEVTEEELSIFPEPTDNSTIQECTQPTDQKPYNLNCQPSPNNIQLVHSPEESTPKGNIPSLLSLKIPISFSLVDAPKMRYGGKYRRYRPYPCHKGPSQNPCRREKRKNQQARNASGHSFLAIHSSGQTSRACDHNDSNPEEGRWKDQGGARTGRDSRKKKNSPTYLQGSPRRVTRSPYPKSKRLDGSNWDHQGHRQETKFYTHSGPSRQRMVQ